MKLSLISTPMLATFILVSITPCSSFVVGPNVFSVRSQSSALRMAVELEPEPEGGEELKALDSGTGFRMKNMGAAEDVKSDEGDVYNFWLLAEADASLIKEYRTTLLKDAAKKADFPGFRKGQIPPYAQPQITGFAVQEGIIKTCEAAVESFGLESISGQDGEINVNEDVKEMSQQWKDGQSIPFTVNFKAIFNSEKSTSEDTASDDNVSPEDETVAAAE